MLLERDGELTALRAAVRQRGSRLVGVEGPAGVGKKGVLGGGGGDGEAAAAGGGPPRHRSARARRARWRVGAGARVRRRAPAVRGDDLRAAAPGGGGRCARGLRGTRERRGS